MARSAQADRPLRAVVGGLGGLALELGWHLVDAHEGMAFVVEREHLGADAPAAGVSLATVRIHGDLHRGDTSKLGCRVNTHEPKLESTCRRWQASCQRVTVREGQ